MPPQPFRWDLLPKVRRSAVTMARSLAGQLGGGALGLAGARLEGVAIAPSSELAGVLGAAPFAAARLLRRDGRGLALVVDAAVAVRATARVLGVPADELAAPRRASLVERGVLAALVAAALPGAEGLRVDGVVDDATGLAPLFCDPWIAVASVELALGGAPVLARILVPESLLLAPPVEAPLASLLGAAGRARLEVPVVVPLVAGSALLPASEVAGLAPGDVVVLDRATVSRRGAGTVRLAVGRQGLEARIESASLVITSASPGATMKTPDDALARELPVPLTVELARLTLSAREILELAPGAVIPLGRPLGSHVELRAGDTLVARGELVEVEGEIGVRVIELKPER